MNGMDDGVTDTSMGAARVAAEVVEPLAGVLDQLLGGSDYVLADAGLARFTPGRLAAIERGAETQVAECLQGIQSLSRLLALAGGCGGSAFTHEDTTAVAWHLHSLAQAMSRWQELAHNAGYFRTHRELAMDIARRYAQMAASLGEWPEGLPTA